MQTIHEVQQEILRLKKEYGVCSLAHSYQSPDILEIADITGDSFLLSKMAAKQNAERLLMCGVRFMAETAKLLSPQKHIYEANPTAGCPMAEQFSPEDILAEKAKHPDCAVVAYVNTSAALKAVSDACVTSSSAVEIVKKLPQQDILFIPDCNLGAYVQANCPEKKLHLLKGGCPYHSGITVEEAQAAKLAHPDALLLVHPECRKEISAMADYVGATSGIMQYAKQTDAKECIIGTEISIAAQLALACPEKRFYPMANRLICPDMRATTVCDVARVLREIGSGGAKELLLPDELMIPARHCLDEMLRLGG